MTWTCLFDPFTAPPGQALRHNVQPGHLSGSMKYLMSGLQTFAGQFLSAIWATYSSLKYFRVDSTGLGRVWPRPHIEASLIAWPSSSRNSTSPSRPSPSEILVRTSSRASLPSRQALHLPQDSSLVNWMKNLETSTMQVSSSITIIPPEPIIEPTSFKLS